jgi:hypothetical protein
MRGQQEVKGIRFMKKTHYRSIASDPNTTFRRRVLQIRVPRFDSGRGLHSLPENPGFLVFSLPLKQRCPRQPGYASGYGVPGLFRPIRHSPSKVMAGILTPNAAKTGTAVAEAPSTISAKASAAPRREAGFLKRRR